MMVSEKTPLLKEPIEDEPHSTGSTSTAVTSHSTDIDAGKFCHYNIGLSGVADWKEVAQLVKAPALGAQVLKVLVRFLLLSTDFWASVPQVCCLQTESKAGSAIAPTIVQPSCWVIPGDQHWFCVREVLDWT